jgi:hypothetical protein
MKYALRQRNRAALDASAPSNGLENVLMFARAAILQKSAASTGSTNTLKAPRSDDGSLRQRDVERVDNEATRHHRIAF